MPIDSMIPAVDPMPLPAPFWLFKFLLVFTFILHIIAMNFMLGGGIIAFFTRLFSKSENHQRLFEDTSRKIPALLAATITLGVAPLLFVQVLYGQFFYTSSILMAWPWFLGIVLLTVGYYGFYTISLKGRPASGWTSWIMLVSLILIMTIGFFYSNNFTLMQTPETWGAKYHADPSGWNLNLEEHTLIPRFLHFMVGAIAVGSFLIVLTGLFRWKREQPYAKFLIIYGGKWFMYTTMVQFGVGVWFLMSLPQSKMLLYMGQNMLATICLLVGIIGALGAIFVMSGAVRNEDPRPGAIPAMGLTALVLVAMAIMRDILRSSYLAPYFKAENLAVKTQWGVLILFMALLVIGLVVWLVMIKKYFFTPGARVAE